MFFLFFCSVFFVLFGFGGPGGGFGAPGGGFSDNRSSGKPLLLLRLKKPPPGPPKPLPKLVRVENLTRTISEGLFNEVQGLYKCSFVQ